MTTYRDIDFNLGIIEKPNGNWINIKNDANDIIQSVKNIIFSSEGQVPFKSYGVGVVDYLYEDFTKIDKEILESNIKNRVNSVEPRVEIVNVNVNRVNTNNILNIEINLNLLLKPKINKTINLTLDPI